MLDGRRLQGRVGGGVTTDGRLRVALAGCGQISEAHIQEARRTGLASIVAVCDRDPDLARQAAARFGIHGEYDDFARMLRAVNPDVVHIATPPASHRELLVRSVEAGAHAYVEKPFGLTLEETDYMLAAASACGRLVCVGHDRLFDPVWLELRSRIDAGEIGRVAHVEWLQVYDLNGPFGRLVLTEPGHWVQRLPGGLFQNALPHAVAAIAELLPDEEPATFSVAWGRERHGLDTDVHVLLRGSEVTASIALVTNAGPPGSYLRVHGTSGWLEADYEARVVRRRSAAAVPSLLLKFTVPLRQCHESARAAARNAWRFCRRDLHYFSGLHALLRAFYRAVLDGAASPMPPQRIRRAAALMDQITRVRPEPAPSVHPAEAPTVPW